MSMHRKNKCEWVGDLSRAQPWFKANVRRQRRRRDIAFESRRRNRGNNMDTPEQKMRAVSESLPGLAKIIDAYLSDVAGERVTYSLIVFTNPRFSYISNSGDRAEIAGALQALIDGWKKGMPDIPAHKVNG